MIHTTLILTVLLITNCNRTTTIHKPNLVVHNDETVSTHPSPDQESRNLRITSTRIAIITHNQTSNPI